MKNILIVLVLLAAGLVAFNYFTTGEVKLMPSYSKSEDEEALDRLRDRFQAAQAEFAQAHRSAGIVGLDTTAAADGAVRSVKQVEKELAALMKQPASERARKKAGDLSRAIATFLAQAR